MDYKYIEQLLEQYWECQTTLEEEAILRAFFQQSDIPARLLPYKAIFQAEQEIKSEARLDKDFDKRMMQLIDERGEHYVAARRLTLLQRLQPLYKVAAVVAIVLSLGMASQYGWRNPQESQMAQGERTEDSTSVVPVDAATATMEKGTDSLTIVSVP